MSFGYSRIILECYVLRSRIPHYIWTNRPLTCCQCSCTCGGAHWRTCERVGNFTVVLERSDPETYGGSEIILVVGPHWPFAITFTVTMLLVFPLTTLLIFWRTVPLWASYTILIVTCCTIASLAVLGCKNPGIAPRRVEKPSVGPAALQKWLWNDQASTWRGQNDSYSQEMNVVLQDVDHICPFTGTAIARRNMAWCEVLDMPPFKKYLLHGWPITLCFLSAGLLRFNFASSCSGSVSLA